MPLFCCLTHLSLPLPSAPSLTIPSTLPQTLPPPWAPVTGCFSAPGALGQPFRPLASSPMSLSSAHFSPHSHILLSAPLSPAPFPATGSLPLGPQLPQAFSPHLPISPSFTGATLSSLWPCHPSPGELSSPPVPPLNSSLTWLGVNTWEPHFSVPVMSLQGPRGPASPHSSQAFPHFPQNIFLGFPGSCSWPGASLSAPRLPPSAPGALHSGSPPTSLSAVCQTLGAHPMTEGHPRAQASCTPCLSLLGHSQCHQWAVDSIDIST